MKGFCFWPGPIGRRRDTAGLASFHLVYLRQRPWLAPAAERGESGARIRGMVRRVGRYQRAGAGGLGGRPCGYGWQAPYDGGVAERGGFEDRVPSQPTARRPSEVEIEVEGQVPKALVLAQWVDELTERFDLDESEARTLEQLGSDFPSDQARRQIGAAIEAGHSVEEVACAAWLREYWREAEYFGIRTQGRRWFVQLTWDTALAIVRAFRGAPDLEEAIHFLETAYEEWRGKVASGRWLFEFDDFIHDIVASPMLRLCAGPGVVAGEGCELLEPEFDGAVWVGYARPSVRFLIENGMIPYQT